MNAYHGSRHRITRFQTELAKIYPPRDDQSNEYVFGYLSRSTGYLGRSLVERKPNATDFMRSLSWLASLATRLDIDLQDAIFSKYSDICPYCLLSSCNCFKTGKQPEQYVPAHKIQLYLEERRNYYLRHPTLEVTFDLLADLLDKVYPGNQIIWHHSGPWFQLAKLQEELAELHEAMGSHLKGKSPKSSVAAELADVAAWIVALWPIVLAEKSIDEELVGYYFHGCPVCRQKTCVCPTYNSRPTGLVDVDSLARVRQGLEDLAALIPDTENRLSDAIASVKNAQETRDDRLARVSVKQATTSLEKVKETLSNVDEVGTRGLSLINTIIQIIQRLPF